MSPLLLGLAAVGRRAGLYNAAAVEALARGGWRPARWMSSLPEHMVLGMPALSPTMTTGNLAKWHVKEGDQIAAGTLLADIETDKAVVAFENQDNGYVAKLLVPEGASDIAINAPLLVVVEEAAQVPAFADFEAPGATKAAGAASALSPAPSSAPAAPAPASRPAANSRIGPAARLLLEVAGLSTADVTPTGPNNIITKGDVLAAMEAGVKPGAPAPIQPTAPVNTAQPAAAATTPAATPSPPAPPPASKPSAPSGTAAPQAGSQPGYLDTPNSQIRKVIAQRLLESKTTIPALYGSVDVGLGALVALRQQLAAQGIKLSVNDFVLKAVAATLEEVPDANRLWDSKTNEPVPAPGIDVSVAVATERGLITPIVKGAAGKTVSQISADVKALAAKAKANKLKPDEFQGGSFTVSNLGMFGVSNFCAIINPPQAAILAVGGAQQAVRLSAGGKPVSESYMTVTLSADHRMYDGELLSAFLNTFKKHIESPANLVLRA